LIGTERPNFQYSFGNELEYLPLSDPQLNAIAGTTEIRRKKKTNFNYISDSYAIGSSTQLENIVYKQNIWPKSERTFIKENRQRTQFAINWWSSARSTRSRNDFVNSMNETVLTSSIWGLDGVNTTTYEVKDTFTPYTASWATELGASLIWSGSGVYENNKKNLLGVGELQNDYSIIIKSGGTFIGPWLGSTFYAQSTTLSPHDGKIFTLPLMESRVQLGSLYARPFSINNVNNLIYKISGSVTYDAFVPHQTVGGTIWSAPEEAGKEPFYYKDYDVYLQEAKAAGKDYSVIPEFRISETIDQILTGEDGLSTILSPMLSITGGYLADDTNNAFYTDYTNSDFLKYFSVIKDKHDSAGIENAGVLKLSCKAIKKFLPYEGFYPAQRIMQLGTLFSQSYYDSGIFSGSVHPTYDSSDSQGNRAGFTPFLAPGVLCNSIKSGISVSFPVFTSSLDFDDRITGSYSSLGGVSRYDNSIPRISASYGTRLTIENLLDPISSADTFYDGEVDETMILFAGNTSVDKTRTGNRLFSYAINNFTAETMNLFLKNRTVSSLISAGENDFIFDPAKEYRMKVRIFEEEMDMYNGQRSFGPPTDDSQQLNGTRASYLPFLPPYDIGTRDQEEGVVLVFRPTAETHSIDYILNNLTESFTIYDDLNISEGVSIAIDNRSKITDSIDFKRKVKVGDSSRAIPSAPEYAISIQPKWECPVLDFSHRTGSLPNITNTYATMSLEVTAPGSINTTTDKITISDGFQEIEFFVRTSNDFANGQIDGSGGASNLITNLRDCITSSSPEYISGSTINHNFDITTPTSTSITFTAKAPGRKVNPVITSNNPTAYTTQVSASGSGFCDNSSPSDNYYVGMWHQYGRIPTGSQGIKMQITEPIITDTTGSLAQALGFTNQSVRIGEIADRRTVKEAIVAIPYTIVEGEKRLFPIDYAQFQSARFFVRNGGERPPVRAEYINLARKGQEYVLPPKYDFFYNIERPDRPEGVSPFAMFVFDFNMTLNRQDLADIWQNLPPTSTNGKKDLTSGFDKEESIVNVAYGEEGSWFPEGLPADTRWMVFKVKQRAAYDYYEQVRDSSLAKGLDERVNVQGAFVNPTYSYNWPYDFFSFVELAKVDAAVDNNITETITLGERAAEAARAAASGREGARERATRSAAEDDATSGRSPDGVGASRGRGGGFFTGG